MQNRLMEMIAWNIYFWAIILSVCQLTHITSFEHKDEHTWMLVTCAFLPQKLRGKKNILHVTS